jgi:DNA-binding transcriptional LysR family regulator
MIRDLDLAVLRSFALIAEGKTFAETAAMVGRSASAITLQIQKLEEQLGQAVFARSGREVSLTGAGERLLGFARRMVAVNDEACAAFRAQPTRPLRFGATQDFADFVLPDVLRRIRMAHPEIALTVRIDRSAGLIDAVGAGELDVAIAIARPHALNRGALATEPMRWIARRDFALPPDGPVPLALFDPPCTFRTAALDALAASGRAHRIVAASPSLSGIRAAAEAGIAITARTRHLATGALGDMGAALGLPPLPDVVFCLYAGETEPWALRDDLTELCRRAFA